MNEIIWHYKSGGVSKKRFSRKHDVILFYSKCTKNFFDWEAVGVERGTQKRNNMKKEIDKDGRVYYTIKSAGKIYKYYDNQKMAMPDVWTDISHLQQKDPERTGYPTQKSLKLLHRIIKASSNEGDIVFDPFCGCATAMVAAQQLGRYWIGIDIEAKASELVVARLSNDAGMFSDFIHRLDIPIRTDVKIEDFQDTKNKKKIKARLAKEFGGICNACSLDNYANLEIDHILPKAKGGQDTYSNYQLLCGNCNRMKGIGTMEYLLFKIAKREEHLRNKITFGGIRT